MMHPAFVDVLDASELKQTVARTPGTAPGMLGSVQRERVRHEQSGPACPFDVSGDGFLAECDVRKKFTTPKVEEYFVEPRTDPPVPEAAAT